MGMSHSSKGGPGLWDYFIEAAYPLVFLANPLRPDSSNKFLLVFLASLFLQFPIYGFVLGYANVYRNSKLTLVSAGLIGAHLIAIFFYGLRLALFP